MSLEQVSYLAQIAGSVGVILSLIFVGFQIRQSTKAYLRSEHNATMAQWTVIRMAIAQNRDIAELMTDGLQGRRTLDPADQMRMEQILAEYAWAGYHVWHRMQTGYFPKGHFETSVGPLLTPLLATERGGAWWRGAKGTTMLPDYAAAVDALLARSGGA